MLPVRWIATPTPPHPRSDDGSSRLRCARPQGAASWKAALCGIAATLTLTLAVAPDAHGDPRGDGTASARTGRPGVSGEHALHPATSTAKARAARARKLQEARLQAWKTVNRYGIPVALAKDGWGDRPLADADWGLEKWAYKQFPIPCNPANSPLPSYRIYWVENADLARTSVYDTKPEVLDDMVSRIASVFAASVNRHIRTVSDLEHSLIPRFITDPPARRGDGVCTPRIDRIEVPGEVLRRETIQNWVNPATGQREMGLYAWLEAHGYAGRDNRRNILIVNDPGIPELAWGGVAGESQAVGLGTYYPADSQPGPQNINNAGGISVSAFTDGRAWDFDPNGGGENIGEILAHEITHSLGSVLPGAPHYNSLNDSFAHTADCADLMCYNLLNEDGQNYGACGGSPKPTWDAFISSGAADSKASVRLDCHRDDYFAVKADGSGQEKPWANQRWSVSRNRFLWGNQDRDPYTGFVFSNPEIPPSCVYDPEDGYCPPGVTRPPAGEAPAAGRRGEPALQWPPTTD